MTEAKYVRWFADITYADVALVGGKNASLGEMYRELTPLGVRQANGFAITAEAFRDALTAAAAWDKLHAELDNLDKSDVRALARAGARCREIVYAAGLPEQARAEVLDAYRKLVAEYGEDLSVAVRSSATAEDLPSASFAGQHDTYLNVRGEEMVLDAIRRCNASLFTDRAISYRIDKGFDHFQVALSACVQKMVRADLASSGVMFSIDTETGFKGKVLATGRAVGTKCAYGGARIIKDARHLSEFRPGEVLVADTTTPDWEPVMKTAAAIVTNRGGRTCHAAIVARELGIPAVVGTDNGTRVLANGAEVTVSCAEGDIGRVYEGKVPYEVETVDLSAVEKPATHIMINLGNPELAFQTSFIPNDGVGLARLEFIISEYIKAHPMALLYPDRVADEDARVRILDMIKAYPSGRDFFIQRLSEGVGTIAAAFWPKPVIVRLSDFKTNEYAALIGGRAFEPHEENPMLGFRGASRYAHEAYRDAFALECAAMRRVRAEMGLKNLRIMVPFCRRLDEADKVLAAMAEEGLQRGKDGLEIYVMCEIPNNVILIDDFAKRFDGFSIGSNDLTQLTLGVDRDSEMVAFDFDERDPGVLAFLRQAVEGAKRNGRHSGICGQAPSDYLEIAKYLVELGIDSMSLTPDSVLKTMRAVVELEREIGREVRRPEAA